MHIGGRGRLEDQIFCRPLRDGEARGHRMRVAKRTIADASLSKSWLLRIVNHTEEDGTQLEPYGHLSDT